MKKFRKFARLSIGLFVASALIFYGWLSFTAVSAKDLPPLQNGDLVFQTSQSSQSLAILAASHSAYTHMGIIQLDAEGHPFVVEATGPVKTGPLQDWIKKGVGGRIAIKRMKALPGESAAKILAAAHVYDGLPYDKFFLSAKNEIYCSELVSLAFKEGAEITLGRSQKVKDLAIDNFAVRNIMQKRWRAYPLCQPNESYNFESCFKIILEQELVTPASIAVDVKLEPVYSNFGVLAN
jgi:hypothetical protein